MIINEKKTVELFHRNEAGETMVNIYYGCDLVCPYCYWQVDDSWAGQITVYTDVAERLESEIHTLPQGTKVSLGWKGNPYSSIEKEYGLTRKCLEILIDNGMDITVSASRGNDIILRDMDLLTRKDAKIKVLIEMTRLDIVKTFNETGTHVSFEVANEIKKNGVEIVTTVSPVLPGITDVEKMAAALPNIPVHIAKLDIRPNTAWGDNTIAFIKDEYPNLLDKYLKIQRTGVDPYYESLAAKYKDGSGQIKPFLPFWDEIPEA